MYVPTSGAAVVTSAYASIASDTACTAARSATLPFAGSASTAAFRAFLAALTASFDGSAAATFTASSFRALISAFVLAPDSPIKSATLSSKTGA